MLKRYVFKCFLNIVTLGEHLIPSGKVFHSVAAAVSINPIQPGGGGLYDPSL